MLYVVMFLTASSKITVDAFLNDSEPLSEERITRTGDALPSAVQGSGVVLADRDEEAVPLGKETVVLADGVGSDAGAEMLVLDVLLPECDGGVAVTDMKNEGDAVGFVGDPVRLEALSNVVALNDRVSNRDSDGCETVNVELDARDIVIKVSD
jgi:hypothetical protein